MALLPTLWPARLSDQSFGMCITSNDLIFPFYNASTNYYRPWKWCLQNVDFGSKVDNQGDYFRVTLDVQHFRPNEITVKIANDQILVEGRHEERKDEHGFIARHFTRRYTLSPSCKSEDVTSNLSSDGILTVTARKKSDEEMKKNEIVIPIRLCKSCPMMERAQNKNETCNIQKNKNHETKNVVAAKNNQIMLKEAHCCLLLKPELLNEATFESLGIKTEKKMEKEELEKVKPVGQTSRNTSEILEETLSKSSTITAAGISEQTSIDKTSTAAAAAEIMEQTCTKSAAATATSSKEMGQTCMATSQMSEIATTSKTSASIESSSYKSSMTSSIKEISDDLSDFVTDILCYELDTNEDTKEFKKQS